MAQIDPRLLVGAAQFGRLGQVAANAVQNINRGMRQDRIAEAMQNYGFDPAANSDMDWLMQNDPDAYKRQLEKFNGLSKKRKMEYLQDMTYVRDQLKMGNVDGAYDALENRIKKIHERGGDPTDSIRMMKIFQQNPAYALEGLENMVRSATGIEFEQRENGKSEATANIKDFQYYQYLLDTGQTEKAEMFANKSGLSKLDPIKQSELEMKAEQQKQQTKENEK